MFVQTDVGLVALAGSGPGEDWRRDFTTDLAVYVDGLPVFAHAFRRPDGPVNVVHPDPTRFLAIWPERNRLEDEDGALRESRRTIRNLWQVRLAALREAMSPDEFVRGYLAFRTRGALDLLQDVPYVPAPLLARFCAYPRLSPATVPSLWRCSRSLYSGPTWNRAASDSDGWSRRRIRGTASYAGFGPGNWT